MLRASSCQRRQWCHPYTYEPPAPASRHLDKCYAGPQNIQSFDDPSSKGKIATSGAPPAHMSHSGSFLLVTQTFRIQH